MKEIEKNNKDILNILQIDKFELVKDERLNIILKNYATTSHQSLLNSYKISQVYEIKRADENFIDVGNIKLLWYGSAYNNNATIISKGIQSNLYNEHLKICNLFGEGSFQFYDSVASIPLEYQYGNKLIFLFLCEVSMGNMLEILTPDSMGNLIPDAYESIKVCGQFSPSTKEIYNKVEIALGPLKKDNFLKVFFVNLDLFQL